MWNGAILQEPPSAADDVEWEFVFQLQVPVKTEDHLVIGEEEIIQQ